jgi:hypothetical protein
MGGWQQPESVDGPRGDASGYENVGAVFKGWKAGHHEFSRERIGSTVSCHSSIQVLEIATWLYWRKYSESKVAEFLHSHPVVKTSKILDHRQSSLFSGSFEQELINRSEYQVAEGLQMDIRFYALLPTA